MNTHSTLTAEEDVTEYIPPLVITEQERLIMKKDAPPVSFEKGTKVKPKFVPVFQHGARERADTIPYIHKNVPLTVVQLKHKSKEQDVVKFEEVPGEYDTCYFKKI